MIDKIGLYITEDGPETLERNPGLRFVLVFGYDPRAERLAELGSDCVQFPFGHKLVAVAAKNGWPIVVANPAEHSLLIDIQLIG
jgi:hypothetical protein